MLKIMINPEHGGSDGGASYGGLTEKNLNLKVSKYCRDYLKNYECEPFLSREDDKYLLIADRVNLLKKNGANAVVTVAHNAGGGDGCEIFYWQGDVKSKAFAAVLEKYYKEIGQNSRGVKESIKGTKYEFGMLRDPSEMGIPAILSEFAFLDNASDRLIVDSEAELKKEGEAIAKAVVEYFGLKKKEASAPTTPSEPETPTAPESKNLYRVGTGWNNGKCMDQKGAYEILQGAITHCKQLGGSYKVFDWNGKEVYPSEQKPTPEPTKPFAGMAVKLTGAKLYGSASAKNPANTVTGTYYLYDGMNIGGRYRITTSKDRCGKTPTGENVTGYVDASLVDAGDSGSSGTAPEPSKPYKGMAVKLISARLYGSASANDPVNTVTGTYYLYDGVNISGRYRITTSNDRCGKTPIGENVTGFVDAACVKV